MNRHGRASGRRRLVDADDAAIVLELQEPDAFMGDRLEPSSV